MALSSGSSVGVVRDVLGLRRQRRDPASSSAFCSWPKSVEGAADDELRLALLAGALAHLLEAVVDQVELERVLVDAGRVESEHAHALEQEARRCPLLPRLPPCLLKVLRTFATVRVGLSVAVSTSTRDAVGRVAFVEDLLVSRPRPGRRRA